MRATRFPGRDGIAGRMAGFVAHLRRNGFRAGAQETADAFAVLGHVDPLVPAEVRRALRCLLAPDQDGWTRFDGLFDAYWFGDGRVRATTRPRPDRRRDARPALWRAHLGDAGAGADGSAEAAGEAAGAAPDADADDGPAEAGEGRLVATRRASLARRDLRGLTDEATLRAAEAAALLLAGALRDRRSRRQRMAARGPRLDLRRILRASLACGGEPIALHRRRRPDRPVRIVALCDVSGSMNVHARVFLAFLRGLVAADLTTEAFVFHTRLLCVTPALRDPDRLRAATRLGLMAEGFGGGTDIAGAVETWTAGYARGPGGRTVVLILSDGCCTARPEALGAALARLRRRVRRVVWLNPLLGWHGYAPVARGIAAALPHLDAHLAANTVAALAALEPEFARL